MSHAPWLAASVGKSTATDSRTSQVYGWLFQPVQFVGNDGIDEY